MSEPAQRSDVVLFNFIFGPSPYTMPTFPFFLQSAEYSGADIVFVGDTPPPMQLPANIRHAPLSWSQLASRLEELLSEPGSPFRAAGMRDAARGTWNASEGERDHRGFKKACDLKPFFALLMPRIVAPYKWWQHSKNTPEMAASIRVLQNSTSSTRRMPDLCGSFGRGFWRAKPKRSGDPCEVGTTTRRRIFR